MCKSLDEPAEEWKQHENVWVLSLNSQGLTAPNHEQTKLGTNSIPSFNPIFKSDSGEGTNSSNTKILLQIMPQQKRPIKLQVAKGKQVHGLSITGLAGCGGHLLLPGRRHLRPGGHLQYGKRGERTCFCKKTLSGNRDSQLSDGEGVNTSPHRARIDTLHKQYFSCGSRFSPRLAFSQHCFVILAHHVSFALVMV